MTDRPEHPAEVLRRLMQRRGLTTADLIAAGCNASWINDLLRRFDTLAFHCRDLEKSRQALFRVTGVSCDQWKQVEDRWNQYAREQVAKLYLRNHAQRDAR